MDTNEINKDVEEIKNSEEIQDIKDNKDDINNINAIKPYLDEINNKINTLAQYILDNKVDNKELPLKVKEEEVDIDSMSPSEFKNHILATFNKELPNIFNGYMKKREEDSIKEQLEELDREHPDWKDIKDEMSIVSLRYPKWSVDKVYKEAVKIKDKLRAPIDTSSYDRFTINGGLLEKSNQLSALELASKAYDNVMNKVKGG